MKNLMDVVGLLRFIVLRFRQDRCAQMASSLTFTTLLSLVPLLTIALTLFSAFPVFAEFAEQIKQFILANMLPETGGRLISQYMEQFAASASKLTAVGVIFLGLTAMLMMLTIDNAFNAIWRVSRPRTVLLRVLTYWAVLTLAPLLVGASLSMTSWLVGVSSGYAKAIPAFGVVLLKVVPVLLTTLAFTLLFKVVPNRYVPMNHALIGGAVAAMAFEYMNHSFALYIANFPTYKLIYGAFASIPIFLLWIYFSWLSVLIGALIAASLSHWRGGSTKPVSAAAQLYYALRILKLMDAGLREGSVQNLHMLSRKLHLGFDTLEQLLEKLSQINVVRKLSGHGWTMIRDAGHVQADELFRLFVFDPVSIPAQEDAVEIGSWLAELGHHNEGVMNVSLRDLFGAEGEWVS